MSTVLDLREEMDGSCSSPVKPQLVDGKAKFLIRTLPRECNPTPVPSSPASTGAAVMMTPTASAIASPTAAKHRTSQTDIDIQEFDNPFDDITEEKLQQVTGRQDLSRVTILRTSVDARKQSVEAIGELLPSLQQLTLENSVLYSFRDLGTSLHSLQVLSVARSGITDLDGIGALTCLQQLYVQHNRIADISPLSMHEELQLVDLEGNCVVEVGQIEQLGAVESSGDVVSKYRLIVAKFVPQLSRLDGKLLISADRAAISDAEVEAAIRAYDESFGASATLSLSPSCGSMGRLPLANGDMSGSQYDSTGSGSLSRSSSVKRISISEASTFDADDAGSSLTHGTDIVFAGNVTSALRRHRSESEDDSPRKLAQLPSFPDPSRDEQQPGVHSSSVLGVRASTPSRAGLERPKTLVRISITDTLDRANELDSQAHRSRDSIMSELRAWQLESAGVSALGVTFDEQTEGRPESPSKRPSGQRRGSNSHSSATPMVRESPKATRRPNTSAGLVRDGWAVREAFTEERPGSSSSTSSSRSRPPLGKHRHSIGGTGASSASPSVDILILDDGGNGRDDDDSKRPCSPVKTPRGIYTAGSSSSSSAMDGRYRQWNLHALSPTIDTTNARQYLPSSLSVKEQQDRVFQHARNRRLEEEDEDESDSDGDEHGPDAESPRRSQGPSESDKVKRQLSAPRGAFFNVAASLEAIDKWRDQVDEEQDDAEDGASSTKVGAPTTAPTATRPLGPVNDLSDDEIVERFKTKHASVSETKTREGFRRFFGGINAIRLEGILRRVFADPDKVRRRMDLMHGHFAVSDKST